MCNYFFGSRCQWVCSRKQRLGEKTVKLQEAIENSMGHPQSTEQREVSSIEEIHEALVLSCEHMPSCTRDELSAIRAGKQPDTYDEAQGLRNSEIIFQQKGMSLQRPK